MVIDGDQKRSQNLPVYLQMYPPPQIEKVEVSQRSL